MKAVYCIAVMALVGIIFKPLSNRLFAVGYEDEDGFHYGPSKGDCWP
jgi:hypothetical protein